MRAIPDQLACALCSRRGAPADVLAGWSVGTERGRPTALCPGCARQYVRDIEARLDPGMPTGLRG